MEYPSCNQPLLPTGAASAATAYSTLPGQMPCPVEAAARIVGQKWTLQIVHHLLHSPSLRFCELQESLGGVNPSTLSSRLKMLEEVGMVERVQISDIPPHVEYSLTPMGRELDGVLREVCRWSSRWLCESDDCGEPFAPQPRSQPRATARTAAIANFSKPMFQNHARKGAWAE